MNVRLYYDSGHYEIAMGIWPLCQTLSHNFACSFFQVDISLFFYQNGIKAWLVASRSLLQLEANKVCVF